MMGGTIRLEGAPWRGMFVLAALFAGLGFGTPAAAAEIPIPKVIEIPGGPVIIGSDRAERDAAYRLDEAAYGNSYTRRHRWYENEFPRQTRTVPAFAITRTPITNAQYVAFVHDTGHAEPDVDARTWKGYGLIHPYSRTRKFAWRNGLPRPGREAHPVVLVALADARAYAAWLSRKTGRKWRLPSEWQWEKAARGIDGRRFPWGDRFDPNLLDSDDKGPFDTVPVGSYPRGASPFGLLDAAGEVYEWTRTLARRKGNYIVKGGSWDDKGCGICRPAARDSRPQDIKHILIGFRLVRAPAP